MSADGEVLLASVFYQRQDDGSRKRYRRGDSVGDVPKAVLERLRRIGAVGELVEEPAPSEVDVDGTDTSKPGEGANKPVLVGWIFDNVLKEDGSDYTKTELNKMKVEELRAIIESVADEPAAEPVEGDD